MENRAAALGLATLLCNTGGDASTEADYVHMLLERRVQGMIFISCEATDLRGDHRHYARLAAEGARLVFVNSEVEGVNVASVRIDEQAAGRIATEHLLELGHRRIGFVAGPAHAQPTRDKAIGREVALRQAALEHDGLVAHADWGFDGGRAAMRKLLALGGGRPTGVICSSDLMAVGALKATRKAGFRVPEDLSIVGFDGIGAALWSEPPLTTLEQPIDEMAESAVQSLQTLFSNPERAFPELVFRPRLRIGGSTGPPPSRLRHG
jgi:DNA-binding LacI/PurR family transcriptional regulator